MVMVSLAVLATGGAVTASALQPADEEPIHGCAGALTGHLRVVDSPDDCTRLESPLSWNQQGPQGDPGVPRIYYRFGGEFEAADGKYAHVNSHCDPGDAAISGTLDVWTQGDNGAMVENTPNSALTDPPGSPVHNVWFVRVRGEMTGRAGVICLDLTP